MKRILHIPVETIEGKKEWIFGKSKADIINIRKIITRIPKKGLLSKDDESIGIILLKNNKVESVVIIAQGHRYGASVSTRTIFKEVLLADATEMVLFHTHPRREAKPSPQDFNFTKIVMSIAHSLGIGFLDHFIYGIDKTLSMAEEGYIRREDPF